MLEAEPRLRAAGKAVIAFLPEEIITMTRARFCSVPAQLPCAETGRPVLRTRLDKRNGRVVSNRFGVRLDQKMSSAMR